MSDRPKDDRAQQAAALGPISQAQRNAARAQTSAVKSTPASESAQRQQAAAPAPGLSR